MDATSGGPRAGPIAEVACASCRRLKMKCIGSDDPPCVRCLKAGRECIVQRPARPQHSANQKSGASTIISQVHSNTSPISGTPVMHSFQTRNPSVPTAPGSVNGFSPINSNSASQAALASIFTTPVYSAVFNQPDAFPDQRVQESGSSQRGWKRPRTSLGTQSPLSVSDSQTNSKPLSDRDIVQYIDIFQKRLLNFIPIINAEDLDVTQLLSTKRQLAHCICYVTARYVPGGDATRAKLVPTITAIFRDQSVLPKGDEEEWTFLQALSVLYAYRSSGNGISTEGTAFEISQWSIKGYIETYSLHLGVHRSISALKANIRSGQPNITSNIGFKKYIYWLWLFNMSHHYSVITGTPPSIREDSTIRVAPEVLKGIDLPLPALQVLAEAELCLLWGKAGLEELGLGEWWCPPELRQPHSDPAEHDIFASVESLLQSWSVKWTAFFPTEPLGPDIEFHFRFTRFCLSTYSVRDLKLVRSGGLSFQQEALNRSVAAAADFCRFTLELGPAIRDAARYMADFGFVMISFACLFIIQACENFHERIERVADYISDVEAVAQMLKEFAINSSHGPNFQARVILMKLKKMREVLFRLDSENDGERIAYEGIQQQFGAGLGDGEDFLNDPEWDLLDFFPEIPLA